MPKYTPNCLILAVAIVFSFLSEAGADERYRVLKGDNLYRIGRKFGISYNKIMAANGLRSTTIYPNQVLVIPSQSKTAPPAPPAQAPVIATRSPDRIHTRPAAPVARANPYRSATVPKDPDPEKPFVIAKKLPKATPITNEEDPLGLGYNPNQNQETPIARARPVSPPKPTYPRIETPVTPNEPQIAQAPVIRSFPRSREVPAAAHYPGRNNCEQPALNPSQFPTPSFKNPCTPSTKKRSTTSSSGLRSYTVQGGDSVWSISRKFGVAPLKLRATNGIMFSKIRPGMRLRIPESHGIWAR
jgi:LysM repeat protein